jgi:hypothetical protein
MADTIIQARGEEPLKKVGINWPENFVDRRESLKMRWNRTKDHQRRLAEDPGAIEAWFNLVLNTKNKWGI